MSEMYDLGYDSGYEIASEKSANRIAELENAQRWIPVGERLPKDASPVMVDGGAAHYSHKYKSWFTNMERDNFGEYRPILWEVTHWMEFTSPPTEPHNES